MSDLPATDPRLSDIEGHRPYLVRFLHEAAKRYFQG